METHGIVNKLEHIVTDTIPNIQEWQNQSVQDLVVKYKVTLAVHLSSSISFIYFSLTMTQSLKEKLLCSATKPM